MRNYSSRISLIENERGVYSIDSTMGCTSGTVDNPKGCYSDCYAANAARRYGYDFTKTVIRRFENEAHIESIRRKIDRIKMPFVRIGTSGDPSEDWEHTLNVCKIISTRTQQELFINPIKEIVIITKHWNKLTDEQLNELAKYPICVNTSVSALHEETLWETVNEFIRLKPFCKSVLRVVSCDFNLDNETGHRLAKVQAELFKHAPTIDTVLRVTKNNPYVLDGIIKVKKGRFLGAKMLISKFNKKTYLGRCGTCKEMCGINLSSPL